MVELAVVNSCHRSLAAFLSLRFAFNILLDSEFLMLSFLFVSYGFLIDGNGRCGAVEATISY